VGREGEKTNLHHGTKNLVKCGLCVCVWVCGFVCVCVGLCVRVHALLVLHMCFSTHYRVPRGLHQWKCKFPRTHS